MLTSFPCCVSSCNSFSPTDNKFATCSDDGTVRIWDFLRCHEERILRGMCTKSTDWGISRGGKPFFFYTRCSQYRSISLSTIFILMLQTSFCLAAAVGALNSERLQFTMALHCLLHLSSKQWRWIEEHFTTPD